MLRLPETYPWDEVFDADRAALAEVYRGGSWHVFSRLHAACVATATPDNHWSDDVKHRGGQDE